MSRRAIPAIAVLLTFWTSAAADNLSRPIRVSVDGHFLQQPDGQPFFWLADTAWELFYRLDRNETERYLKDRSDKGFNVIQAVATGKLDATILNRPNRQGESPFIGGNLLQPNPRYFSHIDWVVERAAQYGLRIAMLPTWGTYIQTGPEKGFSVEKAEAYGRWLGNRYRGRGIIWVLGGDINPLSYSYTNFAQDSSGQRAPIGERVVIDYRPIFDAFARGIAAGGCDDPLITYHPGALSPSGTALPRMSLYFGDRKWFGLSLLQSSHQNIGVANSDGGSYINSGYFLWNATYSYLPVSAEYSSQPHHPVIDGEPRYEDHPRYTSANVFVDKNYKAEQYWRAHDVRNALYQNLFAGAAGHTYGNFSIWDFYDPGAPKSLSSNGVYDQIFSKYFRLRWQNALHSPASVQMQYAKALMLSRPYFSRIPDQGLIVGGTEAGERYIGATRERSGAYAMIYLPQGQKVTVDIARLGHGSKFRAWWFDPRSGSAHRIPGLISDSRVSTFNPPTSGIGNDWILVLDDIRWEFAAPGKLTVLRH